jgi:hypothetical protein
MIDRDYSADKEKSVSVYWRLLLKTRILIWNGRYYYGFASRRDIGSGWVHPRISERASASAPIIDRWGSVPLAAAVIDIGFEFDKPTFDERQVFEDEQTNCHSVS